MTNDDILKIPVLRPDLLFHGDDKDKELYRKLAHDWHPDREGGDLKTFQHLVALYREREQQLLQGGWQGAGTRIYEEHHGPRVRTLSIKYLRQRPFELGQMYICRSTVIYVLDPVHAELFKRGESSMHFKFVDVRMEEEMKRYLPQVLSHFETKEGLALLVRKDSDLIALRDVVAHLGEIPLVHVAWIISRLMGLACYLQYAGIAHGAIDQDTLFISPQRHVVALLGGWWYAHNAGEKFSYLPAHSARVWRTLHRAIQVSKRANTLLDRELIRTTIRELLGDSGGAKLLHDGKTPKPLSVWLTGGTKNAVEDFRNWEKVREKSFGERRFTKWQLQASDIYGLEGP